MEVILIQDVANVGYKDDIVTVKNGYGRNYLIPQGMAILATETNKKVIAENKKQKSYKEDKIRSEATTIAKTLETITLKIGAKAGTSGKIFGSVNAIQIANALKEQFNFEFDRKQIEVDGESIKELGTYKAKVKLHKEIAAEINFEVFAE
ncbi:MAG TPA: 50S ribosomal protein L9 [Bacteroidales bacterium]|nr:50S ribosomal protein L9 [Bacteroidales bacterium]HOX76739.1 50S ribosomal protein L9 [Bacteroidales bacterium]HPM93473.1 50S ribosomal protein L9 [Bacteroidales bacterium]